MLLILIDITLLFILYIYTFIYYLKIFTYNFLKFFKKKKKFENIYNIYLLAYSFL
jgi:hypothetical protein